jgi:hypothetical protein
MTDNTWYNMREAAELLQIKNFGRTKLMRLLKDHQILMSDNCPSVQYVLDGYFSFYNKPIRGFERRVMRIAHVPLISDTGIKLVKDLIKNTNV